MNCFTNVSFGLFHLALSFCFDVSAFETIEKGFQPRPSKALADLFSSLNGKQLRFSSVEDPPWVIYKRTTAGEIVQYTGVCYDIVNTLSEIYNFTYQVTAPSDGAYGTELANRTWNGMVGMILRNESDLGIGSFSVTFARKQVVDFTVAYHEEPNAVLIPPPTEDTRLLACTKPFQTEVWLGLSVTVIVLFIVMMLAGQSSSRSHPGRLFEFVYAVLMSQSGRKLLVHNAALRFIEVVWYLSAVIFTYAYIGALMSFLSVPKLRPIITSLEELPSSSLGWIVRGGTALESLFMESESGVYHLIGNGLRLHPESIISDAMEGPAAVAQGNSAYIDGRSYLEHLMQQDYLRTGICRLSSTKQEFFKVNQAFILAKGSPLAPIFNVKILHMLESGLIQYWKRKHWPSLKQCDTTKPRNREPEKLALNDLLSSFLIWSLGLSLALISFVCELLIDRLQRFP